MFFIFIIIHKNTLKYIVFTYKLNKCADYNLLMWMNNVFFVYKYKTVVMQWCYYYATNMGVIFSYIIFLYIYKIIFLFFLESIINVNNYYKNHTIY